MSRDSRGNHDRSRKDDRRDSITGQHLDGRDHHDGRDRESDLGHDSGLDQVRFSLSGGKVSQVEEFDGGIWKTEPIGAGQSWTFDGTNLIHSETEHGRLHATTFTDPDGDGIFTHSDRSGAALLGSGSSLGF